MARRLHIPPSHTTPLIGITCDSFSFIDKRGSHNDHFTLNTLYTQAVLSHQATPLLIPVVPENHIEHVLRPLHGLIITGGDFDIPPSYYHAPPHALLGKTNPARTACEHALLQHALLRNIPVLGVCGGMQLINVLAGGDLYQDLSLRPHTSEHQQPTPKNQGHHVVHIEKNTVLHSVLKTDSCMTNSTHHQAVHRLGKDVVCSAYSEDGVIEAIELTTHRFVVGVQWHPEAMPNDTLQQKIFKRFIHLCS
jgi:putative glutamine amidotransferase